MEPMTLEDIIPAEAEFTLAKGGRTIRLKTPDISDVVWFKQKYGSQEAITQALQTLDWAKICEFVYRLMPQEDRALFPAIDKTEVNEDGVKVTYRLTGPGVLLEHLSSPSEAHAMLRAFTSASANSNPVIRGMAVEELKKKGLLSAKWTGEKSSISSAPNTGGPSLKSNALP